MSTKYPANRERKSRCPRCRLCLSGKFPTHFQQSGLDCRLPNLDKLSANLPYWITDESTRDSPLIRLQWRIRRLMCGR